MAFLKPQSPLSKGNDYFYPLTTSDQVIMPNGLRMNDVVGKTVTSTITLYKNNWSSGKAPYIYIISVPDLTDKTSLKIYPIFPDSLTEKIEYKKQCAKICHCERDESMLIFECWEDIPNVDINICVEINVLYPLESKISDEVASLMTGLNFSVIGGTTKPLTPVENTIWINTDVKINKVYVGQAAPTNKLMYGDIWIFTTNNGKVVFDMYKSNKIYTNPVSPVKAYQYINKTWQLVPAVIYQNFEWKKWAKLPAEYQEVEYIQTSGTQYINTGIIPTNNTYQVNTKIEVVTTTQNIAIFGTTSSSAYYHVTPYSSKWYYGTNGAEKNGGAYSPTIGKQYTVVYNDKNHCFLTNNSIVASNLIYTSTDQITINGRGPTTCVGHFKYFYFQIINNVNDEIIMDLVPCYRKSDKIPGFYDLVSGKFFENMGSGTLIVGADVK